MPTGQWYTLVRFHQRPEQLTGVSQARSAQEALAQVWAWDQAHPADTTVVFGQDNHPVALEQLEYLAAGLRPPGPAA
jgi:hypothetical protein